jgi:O-antigen biosynthesis protein
LAEVSIIIVNYNVKELLTQCINSIFEASQNVKTEIIVVDNNSFDGSVDYIKNKFPGHTDIKIIPSDINLGFAKANNVGAKYATGEYILILNPDTILQEDTIEKTLSFYKKTQNAGAVTCKLILPSGKLDLACRRSFPSPSVALYRILGLSRLFPKSKIFGKYNLTYLDENNTCEVEAIVGAFMLIKKEIYDKVNGFDEDYFMYGEDIDLCYRINKAGYRIFYYPETSVIHFKGESTKKSSLSYVNNFYGAMQIFVRKNLKTKFWLLDFIIKLSIAYRSIISYAKRIIRLYYPILIDLTFIVIAMLIAIRQRFEFFPIESYQPVIIIYSLVWIFTLIISGVYVKNNRYSIIRPLYGILIGFFVNSSFTYFFNEYAFSRVVVLRTTFNAYVFIAFWRIIINLYQYSRKKTFFKSVKTLIIGKNSVTEEFINKLRKRIDSEYDITGYISAGNSTAAGYIGNMNNLKDIIKTFKIKNIIFAKSEMTNQQMLDTMWSLKTFNLSYKILSADSELLLGKTELDKIDDLYLLQIEYNINRKFNIFVKRFFDLLFSSVSIVSVYPVVFLIYKIFRVNDEKSKVLKKLLLLPHVLSGRLSLVGRATWDLTSTGKQFLGKNGLTGLVQINYYKNLTEEEIEFYNFYYAKNQSLGLDLEIILRTVSLFIFRKKLPRL